VTDEHNVAKAYVGVFGRLIMTEIAIYWIPLIVGGAVVLWFSGFWPGILMLVGAPAYRVFRLAGLVLMVIGVVLGTPYWAVLVIGLFAIGYGELLRRYFLPRQRAILHAPDR